MTFELADPVYYVGTRGNPLSIPAFLSAFGTLLNDAVAEANLTGSLVSKSLNFTAQIGVPGQILAETLEITLKLD